MRSAIVLLLLCLAVSCDSSGKRDEDTRLPTLPVRLPNGKVIRAELATEPQDQQRGLMYRTSLAPDRGMLFVFAQTGQHPFWMYRTLIPLDIIWLDPDRRIVFLSPNTPPCPSEKPEECPNYGGNHPAQFVLELAGGAAAANGLKVGDRLEF